MNNGVMERNGVEYYFVSEQEFMDGLKEGSYLEAEVLHKQQVSGISLKELKRIKEAGKIAINEVGRLGAENIHSASSNPNFIFVALPSFEEWVERLEGRGEISMEERMRRMQSAEEELQAALDAPYFKFVINDQMGKAVMSIRDIVEEGRYSNEEHDQARAMIEKMLTRVRKELGV